VREVEVIADPTRLAAQRLTYDDMATAIRNATGVTAVGRLPQDYRQYLIVAQQEAHSPDDIANVVVGHGLRVRDVATVTLGTEDHVRIIAGDGKPAALLNITRQPAAAPWSWRTALPVSRGRCGRPCPRGSRSSRFTIRQLSFATR
jgi:HAE1 family hydrophobic/amphiphilic exporter-1